MNKTLKQLSNLIETQANDEGLWFMAVTAPEAYLQEELRRLHEACEMVIADMGREK